MTKTEIISLADKIKLIKLRLKGGTFNVYDPDREEVKIEVAMAAIVNELASFCRNHNPRFREALWRDYIDGEVGPNGGPLRGRRRK